jgi:GMP synthase-like glutamine amidotransferase
MRTLIIDNYIPNSPQIEKLYEVISNVTVHTVEVKEASTMTAREDFKYFDVIVLSGSQHKLAESGIYESYANEADFIRSTEKPLLGICFGHQLLCMANGESIRSYDKPLEGYYMVHRVEDDDIFSNMGERFLMTQSHQEYIEKVPYDYIKLAESPVCPVEMVRHKILPKYGCQCHPERYDDKHPAGIALLENFFKIASWYIK